MSHGLVFLFTGQGAQYAHMGRQLFRSFARFRSALEAAAAVIDRELGEPLLPLILDGDDARLQQTSIAQPALFAIEVALLEVLKGWGVTPSTVMGHSLGEITAAYAAGALELDAAARMVVQRGRLMQEQRPGRMLAARVGEGRARELLAPHAASASLAAINGPEASVFSGTADAIAAIEAELGRLGIKAHSLVVSHAFHSPLMDPMLDAFKTTVRSLAMRPTRLELVSNLTGQVVPPGTTLDADYWTRHVREPVRYADGIAAVQRSGRRVLVEVGPHPVLLGMVESYWQGDRADLIPTLRRDTDEWAQLVGTAAALQARGTNVSWSTFNEDHRERASAAPSVAGPTGSASGGAKLSGDALLLRIQEHAQTIGSGDDIDPSVPLVELGFDSLKLLELGSRISDDETLGIKVKGSDLLRYGSLGEIAEGLGQSSHQGGQTSGEGAAAPTVFHGAVAVPALTFFGEYGIADRWVRGERIDVRAFCVERKLDARLGVALAEYLRWYGYLDSTGDSYAATPLGTNYLGRWPGAMLYYSYYPLLTELFPLVRGEKKYGYGQQVYREMYLDTKASGTIGARGGIFGPVVNYLKRERMRCLMDLGCGDGTFLAHAAKEFGDIRIVGLDQSETALASAQRNFGAQGLTPRSHLLQGDLMRPEEFMNDPTIRSVDIATIFFILHEIAYYGLDKVEAFLTGFRKSLPWIRLAITEQFRLTHEEMQPYLQFGYPEFVALHDLTNQRLLRADEWLGLIQRCGFRVVDMLEAKRVSGAPATTGTIVIEAT